MVAILPYKLPEVLRFPKIPYVTHKDTDKGPCTMSRYSTTIKKKFRDKSDYFGKDKFINTEYGFYCVTRFNILREDLVTSFSFFNSKGEIPSCAQRPLFKAIKRHDVGRLAHLLEAMCATEQIYIMERFRHYETYIVYRLDLNE